MANAYITMLDLAKINDTGGLSSIIEVNQNSAPEAALFPANTITGTSYKALLRSALPTGSFRYANEGTETTKSTYENKLVECFYYDTQMEVDNAAATASDQPMQDVLTIEEIGQTKAYMIRIGSQVWYGNGSNGDAKGFPGILQLYSASTMTVDAGGTTADTGSSVWLVKFAKGQSDSGASLIFGKDSVLQIGEWRKQTVTRSSKSLTAWVNSFEGWVGMKATDPYVAARIKKLTADSGKGLTDALLYDAAEKFPTGTNPDAIFMTRRSRGQLRKSRTATNPTGVPAPLPTDWEGVPIYITDSILNTESLTL